MESGNGFRRASQVEPPFRLRVFRGNAYPGRRRNQAHAFQIPQHPDTCVSGVRVLFSFRMLWSSADRTIQVQGDVD